ncbi:MAG TPA: TetR family transcriptional regulator [Solirubrobacteraceae bacterium]|nr:TetR family transcriptional regulator [Solirubrobacteraceae bacterium]
MAEADRPQPEGDEPAPDEEALAGDEVGTRLSRIIAREVGEPAAQQMAVIWKRLDEWDKRNNISEGLRERKKRQTRQRISDVATALFVGRGFDSVTVSEIADQVGVSEKTIYNYFPTKESLVFDQAENQLMSLTAAVRGRPPGSSPTAAFVEALKQDSNRFSELGDVHFTFLPAFAEMIHQTPALRAAWGEHRHQMVETLTLILAEEAGIDPRDPEPITTARALVSLVELLYDSQLRRLTETSDAAELQAAIGDDLDRAARLLDTGLWSFHLMAEGRKTKDQLRDAALAAEQARQQVVRALREARAAWREIREELREAERRHRDEARSKQRAHRDEVREKQREHLEKARQQGRMRGRGRG